MQLHDRRWHQKLYLQPRWVCTVCRSSYQTYDTPQALYSHLQQSHSEDFTETQLQVISRQSKTARQRAWNDCLLCSLTVEIENNQESEAGDKRRKGQSANQAIKRSRMSLATRSDDPHGESSRDSDTNLVSGSDSDSDSISESDINESGHVKDRSKAVARHIAGHLQMLMLLTLRFVALINDSGINDDEANSDSVEVDEGDSAAGGSREKSDMSDLDFQDEPALPGDLQINSKSLEKELREALLISAWHPHSHSEGQMIPKKFLPLDKLDQIITKSSVRAEIKSWGPRSEEDLAQKVHEIWGQHTVYDRARKLLKTSRRKLFAILTLTGKAQTILGLIDAGIYDNHLPFTMDSDTETMKIQWKAEDEPQDIAVFAEWELRDHSLFYVYQWHMLAPYFVLSSKQSPKVHTYKLLAMMPLPFIPNDSVACNHDPVNGDSSEVRQVQIHQAHLDPGSHMVSVQQPIASFDAGGQIADTNLTRRASTLP